MTLFCSSQREHVIVARTHASLKTYGNGHRFLDPIFEAHMGGAETRAFFFAACAFRL